MSPYCDLPSGNLPEEDFLLFFSLTSQQLLCLIHLCENPIQAVSNHPYLVQRGKAFLSEGGDFREF
jgi:hypothetical protein